MAVETPVISHKMLLPFDKYGQQDPSNSAASEYVPTNLSLTQNITMETGNTTGLVGFYNDSLPLNYTTQLNNVLDNETAFATPNSQIYEEDQYDHGARDIIHRIILPIICIFGIVGIILTIVVLSRKSMCTSTNCYLLALSSADLFFLILLSTTLLEYLFDHGDHRFYKYDIYVTYASIFMQMFLMTSIWLTVVLSLERYIAICRPFYAPHICSICRARIIIVVIYIVNFILRTPNFWEHKIVEVYDPSKNSMLKYITFTDFAVSHSYQTVYPWIVDVMYTTAIPFLLLFVLSMRLIWEVRKSTAYIQRNLIVAKNVNHIVQREELQITIMLISVVIVFLICQFPYIIYTVIASVNKFLSPSSNFHLFRYITIMMLSLKAAINFILYCWFSEKFWVTLKKTVCVHYCLKLPRDYSDLTSASLYSLRRHSSVVTRDTSLTAM